jgi:hypothetical protein
LLSRLHRKAEALDRACLRAQGHPEDYSIREELLSALEWEDSLRPDHARATIRESFSVVHEQSTVLAVVLRARRAGSANVTIGPLLLGLRRNLGTLLQVLAVRHAPPA